jgi:hypothetical protein
MYPRSSIKNITTLGLDGAAEAFLAEPLSTPGLSNTGAADNGSVSNATMARHQAGGRDVRFPRDRIFLNSDWDSMAQLKETRIEETATDRIELVTLSNRGIQSSADCLLYRIPKAAVLRIGPRVIWITNVSGSKLLTVPAVPICFFPNHE